MEQNTYLSLSMYPPKPDAYPQQPAPSVTGYPNAMQYPQAVGTGYPNAMQYPQQTVGKWSTGLCDCTQDVGNCCITCWCPCITFGQIAEITDRGSSSCGASGALYTLIAIFTGCQWIYSCTYRSKLRALYSLPEEPCNDCLVHCCCCEGFSLCQMYRELKHRGFDMTIGWHANMERQSLATTQPPVVPGGMMR